MNERESWLITLLICDANEFLSFCQGLRITGFRDPDQKDELFKKARGLKDRLVQLGEKSDE